MQKHLHWQWETETQSQPLTWANQTRTSKRDGCFMDKLGSAILPRYFVQYYYRHFGEGFFFSDIIIIYITRLNNKAHDSPWCEWVGLTPSVGNVENPKLTVSRRWENSNRMPLNGNSNQYSFPGQPCCNPSPLNLGLSYHNHRKQFISISSQNKHIEKKRKRQEGPCAR